VLAYMCRRFLNMLTQACLSQGMCASMWYFDLNSHLCRLRGLLMAVGRLIYMADRLTVYHQNYTVNVAMDQQLHDLLIRDQYTLYIVKR